MEKFINQGNLQAVLAAIVSQLTVITGWSIDLIKRQSLFTFGDLIRLRFSGRHVICRTSDTFAWSAMRRELNMKFNQLFGLNLSHGVTEAYDTMIGRKAILRGFVHKVSEFVWKGFFQ